MKIKTIIIALICLLCFSATSYAAESTELDVGDIGMGTPVAHTHLYQTFHDDTYHWEQCIICGDAKTKTAHTLHGNGAQKNHFTDYYNDAYREVCDCGYVGKPQLVFLGNHSNYTNDNSYLTSRAVSGMRLCDCKQITYSEFNANRTSSDTYCGRTFPGASFEWYDYDGDGLGYVFAGLFVIGNNAGTKGTIELVTGSEGDCGRKVAGGEYYALVEYCTSVTSPTRSGFVTYLRGKINSSANPSSHILYGYDAKYNSISDTQFNKLKTIAQNYSPHPSGVGWGPMCILYSPYEADGHITHGFGGCYDSNHKRSLSYTSGLSGDCDLCGSHFTGTEGYENQWFGNVSCCSDRVRNTPGSTNTCPGHTITGVGGVTIGSFKCQYKNNGGDVYVRYIVTPASGYASSISTSDWCKCSKADRSDFTAYTYPYTAVFTKGGAHVASVGLRYFYMLNDNTRPTAYNYVNDSTANSYWKVEGNGSSDSISTHLRLTATFSDPDQFSYNRVSIRLFDADGVTPIRHSNGDVLLPLVRISGSAGTSGSSALWKGTIDVKAEVKGAKQIYVQAVDSSGNASEKMPMAIMYVDSQGPDITVTDSGNLNSWSNEKTITVTAIDAFDEVWLGVSSEDLKLISVDEYNNTRTYRITGDLSGSKNVAFFARDKVGNVTSRVITFSKLDNTAPSITSVATTDVIEDGTATGWKITSTGADHGSGISGTALIKGDREPEAFDYSNTYVYEVTRSGDYYLYMKDNVGNTSKSAKIHIRSDVTYNGTEVNEIEFNGTDLDCLYYGDKRLRL